jgi:hypothetical protein
MQMSTAGSAQHDADLDVESESELDLDGTTSHSKVHRVSRLRGQHNALLLALVNSISC